MWATLASEASGTRTDLISNPGGSELFRRIRGTKNVHILKSEDVCTACPMPIPPLLGFHLRYDCNTNAHGSKRAPARAFSI